MLLRTPNDSPPGSPKSGMQNPPPPVPISRPISAKLFQEQLLDLYPPPPEEEKIVDPAFEPPEDTRLTTVKITAANDEVMRKMHPPGSAENPLLFEGKTISNLVINVDETKMHMAFNNCTFDCAALMGTMKNVSQSGNIIKNVGQSYNLVKPPGTKTNPLIFKGITFSHLDFNFGSVEMRFHQCHFIKCVFVNGEGCVFNHCRFTDVPFDYTHTPFEFYILAQNGSQLFGRICASEIIETKSKRKNLFINLIKYIKTL
jgi:hypothetical protein